MRKTWLLALLAAILFTGCGEKPGKEILREAPAMHLSGGEQEKEIRYSSSGWDYRVTDIEWQGYRACGAHPVMMGFEQDRNILPLTQDKVSVWFDIQPASIQISYWKEMDLGNESAYESGISIKPDIESEGRYSFLLPSDSGSICVVWATWKEEDYKGDGEYIFLMSDRTPEEILAERDKTEKEAGTEKPPVETEPDIPNQDGTDSSSPAGEGAGGKEAIDGLAEGNALQISLRETTYSTDVKEIVMVLKNTGDTEYEYGSAYYIEYWDSDQWKKLEYKENTGFCGVGNLLQAGKEYEVIQDISYVYDTPLKEGKYRICLAAYPSERYDEEIVYTCEFTVIK